MFGLFGSPKFTDPSLGTLDRFRGMWRGSIVLAGHAAAPLALCGDKREPDPAALVALKRFASEYERHRLAIEEALFEHYEPYGASAPEGNDEAGGAPVPTLAHPGQAWPHVTLRFVAAAPLARVLTIELGFSVAWDPEHTVGARFQDGRLVELNGSVLAP